MELLETGLFACVAGFALFLGVVLIQLRESWARRNTVYLAGFAAGTMMAITFLHLLPEAVEMADLGTRVGRWALPACLITFFAFYALEQFVVLHPCEEDGCGSHAPAGELGLIAILFHSGLDGVLIGVGFEVSHELGLLTTLGIVLHNLPVGVTAMSLFFVAGMDRKRAWSRAIGLAVATPVGAVLAQLLLSGATPPLVGLVLAASGGSFLYVAASDLIPMTHRYRRPGVLFTVLAGAGIVFSAGLLH